MKVPKYLDRPIFDKIARLVLELYKIHSAGGLLHIVLDDGNWEDCHIKWCLNNMGEQDRDVSEEEKRICRELGNALLKIKESQRYWIWKKVELVEKELEENNDTTR